MGLAGRPIPAIRTTLEGLTHTPHGDQVPHIHLQTTRTVTHPHAHCRRVTWYVTPHVLAPHPNHNTKICPTSHNTASRSYEGGNADPIPINCRTLRLCPNHHHLRMFYPRLLQVKNIAMRPFLSTLKMRTTQYRTAGRFLWWTRLQKYV